MDETNFGGFIELRKVMEILSGGDLYLILGHAWLEMTLHTGSELCIIALLTKP